MKYLVQQLFCSNQTPVEMLICSINVGRQNNAVKLYRCIRSTDALELIDFEIVSIGKLNHNSVFSLLDQIKAYYNIADVFIIEDHSLL